MALSIATIFVAVFVFHADLHATAGPIFIVTPVVSISVRAAPASIVSIAPLSVSSAILVAIPIIIAVATHPPVATHLTVIGPRLVAIGSLIPLLLRILVRLGRNCLRLRHRWSFSLLLGE